MESMRNAKKIVIIGDPYVGKTSLQSKYLGMGFTNNYLPTLGMNFSIKDYEDHLNGKVRVAIWDLSGHKLFKDIRERAFVGIHGLLLVYDVTRIEGPEHQILPWIDEILEFGPKDKIPVAIVANKIDLDNLRQIFTDDGVQTAIDLSVANDRITMGYFETSAKNGYGVDTAFSWLISTILEQ